MKKVICKKYLYLNLCRFEEGKEYDYYEEENFSEPYGESYKYYYVYKEFVIYFGLKGTRIEESVFKEHFTTRKEILNKKLKKINQKS